MQYITYDVSAIFRKFKLAYAYLQKKPGDFLNIILQTVRDILNYTQEMFIHQTHGLFFIKWMEIVSVDHMLV